MVQGKRTMRGRVASLPSRQKLAFHQPKQDIYDIERPETPDDSTSIIEDVSRINSRQQKNQRGCHVKIAKPSEANLLSGAVLKLS